MAHRFRELTIWQRAMQFIGDIYRFSQVFPPTEQYGLTSQLRRAATSIALNIAEGSGCSSSQEFAQFLSYSLRSTYETMTALEIARMLQYGEKGRVNALLAEADQLDKVSQWEIQFYGLSCSAPSGRSTIDPNCKVPLNHVLTFIP